MNITTNKIRCNHCHHVIESRFRHEFVWCPCATVAVDGGKEYLRRVFKNSPDDFTELSSPSGAEVSEVRGELGKVEHY